MNRERKTTFSENYFKISLYFTVTLQVYSNHSSFIYIQSLNILISIQCTHTYTYYADVRIL